MLERFFKLEENHTTARRELLAGLTTFFAMVYIIVVNPQILGLAGMPAQGVFLATIIATVVGTLFMGLFANVPYSLAPGMGLNAFFTFTVCGALKFSWQEALALVFLCGIINILITVTNVRKHIIKAIPVSLQHAIGGGIGIFIFYIGLLNSKMISFGEVPALTNFANWGTVVAMFGITVTVLLLLFKVPGAILIGIIATTLVGIPFKVTDVSGITNFDLVTPFVELKETFFAFGGGLKTLFSDVSRLPIALLAIFAFSLTDTFDTIGTFIGTGRKSGVFSDEDLTAIENHKGMNTKMERALFADSIATSVGAVFGTSNTTTYVESAAGIEAGGRTGLTSVFTALFFALSIVLAPVVEAVPFEATTCALVVVGIMMAGSFKEVNWPDFAEAVPAFLTAVIMALTYNISLGIAFGFIFYVIVKLAQRKAREVHPILWVCSSLFLLYFVLMALNGAGII